MLRVKEEVHRMAGNYEVDENDAEVGKMFNRMHGEARPWTRIGVLVMEVVDPFIEWLPMGHSVHPIEVELAPDGDCQEPCCRIVRSGPPIVVDWCSAKAPQTHE